MIKQIRKLPRIYRNIDRYREIIFVLIRHGFGDFINFSKIYKIANIPHFLKIKNSPINKLSRWERIRLAIEDLGPTFIKFGQIMSNRPDILPIELINELKKLQDAVKPFSSEMAIHIIEKELNKKINVLFLNFTPIPIAAASIAQVHSAKLFSGEIVVVKVQRPRIKRLIEVDIEIMRNLAQRLSKRFPEIECIDLVNIIDEFGITVKKEIDFVQEASNIERFAHNFKKNKYLITPQVFKEYSSKKVLTMEYIDGISINELTTTNTDIYNKKLIASRGANLILSQIFDYGFFHADPHPGNIMIINNNRICFLDYGQMGMLLPKHRQYLGDFIIAFVEKDASALVRTILEIAHVHEPIQIDDFENKISELIDQFAYHPLKDINMGEIMEKVLAIVVQYKLRFPSSFYLLSKAMITIEGVARQLEPDFDMFEQIKPYAKKIVKERLSPIRLLKEGYKSLNELIKLILEFPEEFRAILKQFKHGKVKIIVEHYGLENYANKQDIMNKRISLTILISSMLIGSSLIVLAKVPPFWKNIPMFGLAGFILATIMGIILVYNIITKK